MDYNTLNIRSCANRITDLTHIAFDLGLFFNNIGNMSIVPVGEDDLLVSFRIFGYFITSNQQRYLCHDNMRLEHPDQHIFVLMDKNLNLRRRLEFQTNEYYKPDEFQSNSTYLEDGRMNVWMIDGKPTIYLTSATFYTQQENWEKFGLEVQRVDVVDGGVNATHFWNSVESGIMGRHKNWMAVPDRPFTFVMGTSSHGAQIADISPSPTIITNIMDYDPTDMYRGNTPLVKWGEGYLTITHRLAEDDYGRKVYLDYFVQYDKNLMPIRFSKPFKLTDKEIEFTTTLIDDGENFVIGNTIYDETPEVLVFDKRKLLKMVNMVE